MCSYSHLGATTGNPVTVPHIQAQQDLPIVDRILEPQTIAHFIEFALGRSLPDGSRPSSIDTLADDEVVFLRSSYPPGSDGEPILNRVVSRIGSEDDHGRLCIVGKNIQSLKSRLWEGITPLSDQRWQEKGLHIPDNFHEACQHLSAVVAVFEYLNIRKVRQNLRETFNLIYDHFETLDTVLNQQRTENGAEHISVASLWTTYMTAHFKVMTERAHTWVVQHVDALRAPLLQGLLSHESSLEGSGTPDQMQWQLTDALHMLLEISVRADYMIMIPMEGYKGYTTPKNGSGLPKLYSPDLTERGRLYSERVKILNHQAIYMNLLIRGGITNQPSGVSYHESTMGQIDAQKQVRKELRGDSTDSILQEHWITHRLDTIRYAEEKNNSLKDCGLVIYRLTYGQSETEWAEFVQKLEAHVSGWEKGEKGSDAIKPHLKLHWIDGKELGLAEGDIEAAKKHFIETVNNDEGKEDKERTIPLNPQSNAFLVIDSASFESYTTDLYGAATSMVLPGDFTGFVLAIDPWFDPKKGIDRPEESPGYCGKMRILGSLVWGDLFALLESQSARLDDLWPLAMHHPNQVYVGPTVPLQVFNWRTQNAVRWNMVSEIMQHVKRKMGRESS
ncbi:hypothetical protein BGW36DRAFT_367440 [Talaromyces proteolyticus]|uniref:Uncharacterized protein n=1 Tax=Talaromyces proteolyticus TaxID=1131652 RepID=A0AAD4L0N8_9EURO|nr:uncharacterized protein BGW36DRAFT_367440 [Talaromyces proteolyticus]KAH8705377.1 hypothetical protein BGW36DRAFT_367440 [Talaromyces proteolyticus]